MVVLMVLVDSPAASLSSAAAVAATASPLNIDAESDEGEDRSSCGGCGDVMAGSLTAPLSRSDE